MWVLLSIVCALAFGTMSSYAKALTRRVNLYVITWSMISLAVPWLVVALAMRGIPPIGERFLVAALVSVVLNIFANTLHIKALSLSPLSLTIPFLAFTPMFMILTGAIVLGELPDAKGLAGIALVVAGAYAINLEKIRGGLLLPMRAIVQERGSLLMLIVSFIWSVTSVYDKVAVVNSSPQFYMAFFSVAFAVLYLPALIFGLRKAQVGRGDTGRLFLVGAVFALMGVAQMTAIELTLASYVISIKRAGMIVSVVLGYLFFGEKHLRVRLVGALLMTVGVLLLSS
jgi:drug/metabolite transporter (DMT)-like permease